MDKKRYILFTSGRGPVECGLAVHGVVNRFKQYLDAQDIKHEIVRSDLGQVYHSIDTIIFSLAIKKTSQIEH